MKLGHLALVSVGTMVVLSGCYERGKATPPTVKKLFKKKQEEKVYDFPVLKLSASEDDNRSAEEILATKSSVKTVKISTSVEQSKKILANKDDTEKDVIDSNQSSQTLRFPKMSQAESSKEEKESSADTAKPKQKKTKKTIPLSKKEKKQTKDTLSIKKDALKKVLLETKRLQEKDKPKVQAIAKQKRKQATKNKVHRRAKHNTSSSQIPIVSSILKPNIALQDIPIINKLLPKPSETSKGRIRQHTPQKRSNHIQPNRNTKIPTLDASSNEATSLQSFSGGTSSTNLDMAKIRIETDNYQTNIILDSYRWVGYNTLPTETSPVSGIYFFKYEPQNDRIIGHIKGYNSFSALVTKKDALLKNNPLIKSIYIDRYVGDDGIKFIIELKKSVKVNVIDVEDPGSIIIELYPK